MSAPTPNSSSSAKMTDSFLAEWSKGKLAIYEHEYGGERAGVVKGNEIPFPRHKIGAAVALLAYGAPNHETLTTIARPVHASSALLRVWRTEERFLSLYRRAVWECADDFILRLARKPEELRLSPVEEFQQFFGVALQQILLRRLCADVLGLDSEWVPLGLRPKWLSEYTLVGLPPKTTFQFSRVELLLLKNNADYLLSTSVTRMDTSEPGLAHWASMLLLNRFIVHNNLKDVSELLDRGKIDEAAGIVKWLTKHSPHYELETLHRLVRPAKKGKRRS